jgi:hypothetical protein
MSKSKDIARILNQEMTREEALAVINDVEEELSARGDTEMEYKLDRALCALGVYKQPDPITGLAPCGCGGVVEQTDFHDGFFPYSKVECLECGDEIMRAGYTASEAHSEAKGAWNTSHGYTAPSRPGAKEQSYES